jgi:hypothetical protein
VKHRAFAMRHLSWRRITLVVLAALALAFSATGCRRSSPSSNATASTQTTVPINGHVSSTTTPTTAPPPKLVTVQLLSPNGIELDWSGFVISPTNCEVVSQSDVQVTGSVTVPPLVDRGQVEGQIEAWVVGEDGTSSAGLPWQIPNAAGQFDWNVSVQIVPGENPSSCEVQGIDPNYHYTVPQ